MQRTFRLARFVVAFVLLASLAGTASVSAESGTATYVYLIGCDLDEHACPIITAAPNGDTIELSGQGTLSIHPKWVTGGGTFVYRDAQGNVLAEGTWWAEQLLSFVEYGCDPADPTLCGGRARMRIHLSGVGDGNLRVDCLIGDKVPHGAREGIRLALQGGPNFNREVHGETLFVKTN